MYLQECVYDELVMIPHMKTQCYSFSFGNQRKLIIKNLNNELQQNTSYNQSQIKSKSSRD